MIKKLYYKKQNGLNPYGLSLQDVIIHTPEHTKGTWFDGYLAYTWANGVEEAKENFKRFTERYDIPESGAWSESMNPNLKKSRIH